MSDGRPASPVGVVVVSYASSELLELNLTGLTPSGATIVVVDNLSTAEERARVERLSAEQGWVFVGQPDNRGFGAGANAGVEVARRLGCGAVLLLNPDVVISDETVRALHAEVLADPRAVVAPRLVDETGSTVFSGHSLDLADGRIVNAAKLAGGPDPGGHRMFWLTAACLMVDVDLYSGVGGFSEDYFMYWEDVDLNRRLQAAGGRAVWRGDLVATHEQGGTQGTRRGRAKSPLYYRYNIRNRMLFGVLWLERREVLRWLVRTPRVAYEVWLHGGRRQLWEAPAGLLGVVRGTAEALVTGAAGVLRDRHVTRR